MQVKWAFVETYDMILRITDFPCEISTIYDLFEFESYGSV